jgi:hypothetical protein
MVTLNKRTSLAFFGVKDSGKKIYNIETLDQFFKILFFVTYECAQ